MILRTTHIDSGFSAESFGLVISVLVLEPGKIAYFL